MRKVLRQTPGKERACLAEGRQGEVNKIEYF
jgi:hypothetical protein